MYSVARSLRPLVAFRTSTHAFRYNTTLADCFDKPWWGIWVSLDFLNGMFWALGRTDLIGEGEGSYRAGRRP